MAERDRTAVDRGASRGRVAQVLAVFAACNLVWAAVLLLGNYPLEPGTGKGPMPDFAAHWAAARLSVEGTPLLAYDLLAHRAAEVAGFGAEFDGILPWYYPPIFQFLLLPLGFLSLAPAMAVWVLGGLGFFLWVCQRIVPDRLAVLGGLAAAPTLLNLVNGQTGFVVAALAGLVLLEAERRPVRAGIALGLLAIKPHAAFAVPLALMAAGRWRTIAVGAATLLVLALLTALALGPGIWTAFFAYSSEIAQVLTGGEERRWEMHPTIYGVLRLLDTDPGLALAIHAVPAVVVLWLTFRAWRMPDLSLEVRAALVCYATALAMPRMMSYDLQVLTIGVLFQVAHALRSGFFRHEPALIGAVLLAAEVSVFDPAILMPLLAPALFLGCLFGHARAVLPRQSRSAVPSGGRSWVERG